MVAPPFTTNTRIGWISPHETNAGTNSNKTTQKESHHGRLPMRKQRISCDCHFLSRVNDCDLHLAAITRFTSAHGIESTATSTAIRARNHIYFEQVVVFIRQNLRQNYSSSCWHMWREQGEKCRTGKGACNDMKSSSKKRAAWVQSAASNVAALVGLLNPNAIYVNL